MLFRSPIFRSVLAFAGVPLVAVLLMGASMQHHGKQLCNSVEIHISSQADNLFLDLNAVKSLLGVDRNIRGAMRQDVYLTDVEQALYRTKYVKQVVAEVGADHSVTLQITLRKPIARIMDGAAGQGFYIDESGFKIPLSTQFTARLPIVRGKFKEQLAACDTLKDSTLLSLLPLLSHIHEEDFLRAQISELHIDRAGDITLYPEVGHTPILMGSTYEHARKLKWLSGFYRQVLSKTGWDYYRVIDLRYARQIIAIKQDA